MKKERKDLKQLRHGYTTGANATAATKAALLSLLFQKEVKQVSITLPKGMEVSFNMEDVTFTDDRATASVIKDGGDDPDATHGALITSSVKWIKERKIVIDGGIGVGRVTKDGLPVPVGEAAINPVPRKMIRDVCLRVLDTYKLEKGVKVIISVPKGEEIAKDTMNARLGIIGGISILGTSGIVVPFSTAAYRASVAQAIKVARKAGCRHLFLTTGGRSEKYAMSLYPDMPEEAFIEVGDFVGFALKHCQKQEIKKVTLVGMMGKFSKVAQGVMMVHSRGSSVDFDFLADLAEKAGAPRPLVEEVRKANTASQVGTMMKEHGIDRFFTMLCRLIAEQGLKQMGGNAEIETVIITMKNELLGRETVAWNDESK